MSSRPESLQPRQAHNLGDSNPFPATTFVITHSPSRFNRRDGCDFFGEYTASDGSADIQIGAPSGLRKSMQNDARLLDGMHKAEICSSHSCASGNRLRSSPILVFRRGLPGVNKAGDRQMVLRLGQIKVISGVTQLSGLGQCSLLDKILQISCRCGTGRSGYADIILRA